MDFLATVDIWVTDDLQGLPQVPQEVLLTDIWNFHLHPEPRALHSGRFFRDILIFTDAGFTSFRRKF